VLLEYRGPTVLLRRSLILVAVALAIQPATAASARVSNAAAPPPAIFKPSYNLCKLATLPALEAAAGATLSAGSFDGKFCNWSSSDGNDTVMVTTHPGAWVAELDVLVQTGGSGQKGEKVSNLKVPGASRGVLDAFPYAQTHRYASDLYAVYPQGVVQVSFNYAKSFPIARMIAVMRLLTGT
jgi:hypothetical protein